MYPLLSLRSLPTWPRVLSPLPPPSDPGSQFIWMVFNTAVIHCVSPYSAGASVQRFPLAKLFCRNLIIHRICVIDFLAMFLPSSDKWSIPPHWLSVAFVCIVRVFYVLSVWPLLYEGQRLCRASNVIFCSAQIPRHRYDTRIWTLLIIWMGLQHSGCLAHMATSISLPCKFDLNVAAGGGWGWGWGCYWTRGENMHLRFWIKVSWSLWQ